MRNESGYDSFLADSTAGVLANRRVKLVPGTRRITLAGVNDREVAITKRTIIDNKTPVECQLANAAGGVEVEVAGEYESGDELKRAADGKVTVGGAGSAFGIADGNGEDQVSMVFPY